MSSEKGSQELPGVPKCSLLITCARVADGELLCREMKNRNSWKWLWDWPSMIPLLTSISCALSGSGHLSGMGSLAGICPASAEAGGGLANSRPPRRLAGASRIPGLRGGWQGCREFPASAKQRRPGKSLLGPDLPGLHPKSWILGLQGQVSLDSRAPRTASRPRQIPARPPTIIEARQIPAGQILARPPSWLAKAGLGQPGLGFAPKWFLAITCNIWLRLEL